jgi:lipopolysaccharide export system protein LptA
MLNKFPVLFCWLLFLPLFSQKDTTGKIIEIRNADRLTGMQLNGEKIQRLVGRVALFHEGAMMYCDSAWVYDKTNSLDAWGQIHIRQGDTLSLYGDTLHYNGNTKIAEIQGRVRMVDPGMQLLTNRLTYNRNTGEAIYRENAKIRNKEDRITSKRGTYHSDSKTFTFEEDVYIENPDYTLESEKLVYETQSDISRFYGPSIIRSEGSVIYCENGWHNKQTDEARFSRNARIESEDKILTGDSIYYRRGEGYGLGLGNIELLDTTENISIRGDFAETWKDLNMFIVTERAQMIQYLSDDTLYMHADTLKGFETETGFQVLMAWYGVKFFKRDLQGACDSLYFTEEDSLMRLHGTPVIWSDESQMTAIQTNLKIYKGTIYSFHLFQNALLVSQDDSIRFNQVGSINMDGLFAENKLYRVKGYERGEMIYFPREEDGSLIGLNELRCINIQIDISDNEVEIITCRDTPEGTLHPWEKADPLKFRLDAFIWHDADRPKQPEDIFIKRKP